MALNKGDYRLYKYDRMGGLVKLYGGNKGHDHDTLEDAKMLGKAFLLGSKNYHSYVKQILIIHYNDNWNSEIVEILNKNKENEIRSVKV